MLRKRERQWQCHFEMKFLPKDYGDSYLVDYQGTYAVPIFWNSYSPRRKSSSDEDKYDALMYSIGVDLQVSIFDILKVYWSTFLIFPRHPLRMLSANQ